MKVTSFQPLFFNYSLLKRENEEPLGLFLKACFRFIVTMNIFTPQFQRSFLLGGGNGNFSFRENKKNVKPSRTVQYFRKRLH